MELKNFKAFEEQTIEFRPITLFLGPNNSGKSSILAALRILVQTVESFDPQVPVLLNGVMGDFGTYRDVVFDNSPRRHIHIAVSFSNRRQVDPNQKNFGDSNNEVRVHYAYRSRRREIVLKSVELRQGDDLLLATNYSEDSERQSIDRIGSVKIPSALKSSISRNLRMQNFVPSLGPGSYFRMSTRDEESALSDFIEENPDVDEYIKKAQGFRVAANLHRAFRSIEYLGAMRMPPSRTYLFTGERRNRIGANGENAASILVMDSARGGSRSLKIADSVKQWLRSAGIGSDLEVKHISDRHYEIRIQHPQTKEYQNFADVGYGNSQVLPVLIGGLNLHPNSTFMVEQPEIHLHPRAQAELGDYFLQLLNRDVQSAIETHSEHLILRLQQHVASGKISPQDIAVYYVYAHSGKKRAQLLELGLDGAFIDEWPEGFFPERLEEAKKLSKTRYQKQLSR